MRFIFPVYLADSEWIKIYFEMLLKRVGSSCSERDRDLPHQHSPPHYHKLQWIHWGRQPESLLCYCNDSASTLVTLSNREQCNHTAAHREALRRCCCTHTPKPITSSSCFIFPSVTKSCDSESDVRHGSPLLLRSSADAFTQRKFNLHVNRCSASCWRTLTCNKTSFTKGLVSMTVKCGL